MELDPAHERRRELRLKQFEMYRNEDKHECTLTAQRLMALLASQALLAAAAAAAVKSGLEHPDAGLGEHAKAIVLGIGILAMVLAMSATIAISIGCCVLRLWHDHGRELLAVDKKSENFLRGFHLNRVQPDLGHLVSIDFFSEFTPFAISAAWMVLIVSLDKSLSWLGAPGCRKWIFLSGWLIVWIAPLFRSCWRVYRYWTLFGWALLCPILLLPFVWGDWTWVVPVVWSILWAFCFLIIARQIPKIGRKSEARDFDLECLFSTGGAA